MTIYAASFISYVSGLCNVVQWANGMSISVSKGMEINLDRLLLAETEQGQTAFHLAAQKNHAEILQ